MSELLQPVAGPFPEPSPLAIGALDELRLAAGNPPQSVDELRRVAALPRPWDPPTCPPTLRKHMWRWLDEVVCWINEEHTWRVDSMVPLCWAEHPHIVHEVATVACLRRSAMHAVTPDALEEWHRYTLPMFLGRITERIGGNGCPPGKHQKQPGGTRIARHKERSERGLRAPYSG